MPSGRVLPSSRARTAGSSLRERISTETLFQRVIALLRRRPRPGRKGGFAAAIALVVRLVGAGIFATTSLVFDG